MPLSPPAPRVALRRELIFASIAVAALIFGREVRLLAVPLEAVLLYLAYVAYRAGRETLPVKIVRSELSVLWYALFSWRRKAPPGFTAYKRAGWGAVYFALGLVTLAEGAAFEILWPHWWTVALHIYALLWLLGDLRAMQLRPIQLAQDKLLLRIGLRWQADIPISQISSVDMELSKGLKLGVLGSPNLHLQFREAIELQGLFGVTRRADSLLLQIDDPGGLRQQLEQSISMAG